MMKFPIGILSCLGLCLYLAGFPAPSAFGQLQMIGNPANQESDLLNKMKLEIDAMQRCFQLNEKAVQKLEVAAEMAIKAVVKERAPLFAPNPPALDIPKANQQQTLSDEEDEQKAEKEARKRESANKQANFPGQNMGLFLDVAMVKQHAIWNKAVGAVLSNEQLTKWLKLDMERKNSLRRNRVDNMVQELDNALLLSPEQRIQVYELVDRVLGEDLMNQPILQNGIGGLGLKFVVVMNPNLGRDITKEELAPILSPFQLKIYEERKRDQGAVPIPGLNPVVQIKDKNPEEAVIIPTDFGFDFQFTKQEELLVAKVHSPSMASKAGLKEGDSITFVNDVDVQTPIQLRRALKTVQGDHAFTITVTRDGKKETLRFAGKP